VIGRDGGPDAVTVVGGCALDDACAASAHAAAGVQDEDGMLVWVELPPGVHPDAATAATMDTLLAHLGCTGRLAVAGGARLLPGGTLDTSGDPLPAPPDATVRLVRAPGPGARPVFPETPIVPISVWQPLQAKRVRYFRKPPPPKPAASQ